MSGCEDSGRQQTAGRASIFGDGLKTPAENGGGDRSDAVVHASVDQLCADAYNARRQRDLLATKVALLAYKLQMNSQERRHHNHQLCQPSLCNRLVWYQLNSTQLN